MLHSEEHLGSPLRTWLILLLFAFQNLECCHLVSQLCTNESTLDKKLRIDQHLQSNLHSWRKDAYILPWGHHARKQSMFYILHSSMLHFGRNDFRVFKVCAAWNKVGSATLSTATASISPWKQVERWKMETAIVNVQALSKNQARSASKVMRKKKYQICKSRHFKYNHKFSIWIDLGNIDGEFRKNSVVIQIVNVKT